MVSPHALAPRPTTALDTIHEVLGMLAGPYRTEEVLTAVRQVPAREAEFRPMPTWVTSALAEAYRGKGIGELYSHQASTAELVRDGKNVVVVTPTASGKTLCDNLPVLNAVLENLDTCALYLFPTKALAQDRLAELQDLAKLLCAECDVVSDSPHDACLVCGSSSLFNIAHMFGGNLPKDRASLVVRKPLEMKPLETVLTFPKPHRPRRKASLIAANAPLAARDHETDEVEGRVLFGSQG